MESRANDFEEIKENDFTIPSTALSSSTKKINTQLNSSVNSSTQVELVRDDGNKNPYILDKLKNGFDFLVLALIFAGNDLIKSHCDFGGYNKITCFISAGLYFKFRNVLNPVRDELGIYKYFLAETKRLIHPNTSKETPSSKRLTHLDSEIESENEARSRKKLI